MTGELSQSLLSPEFVAALQTDARRYALIERAKSRREWHFGRMVNDEWERVRVRPDVAGEVTRRDYLMECSYRINEMLRFPIVAASGETLRRWCDIVASYASVPRVDELAKILSFDHFTKARTLANRGKVPAPLDALLVALEQKYTSAEMVEHFDPPAVPDAWGQALGHLDSLMTAEYEYLKPEARGKLMYYLGEARRILEAQP